MTSYREQPAHKVLSFLCGLAAVTRSPAYLRYFEELVDWMVDAFVVPTSRGN